MERKKSLSCDGFPNYYIVPHMNKELTDFEKSVILDKGTELPFSGEYCYNKRKGTYVCRQCGEELYRSEDKFESSCGWPSFDDEIDGAVKRSQDADGFRTEITCAKCGGHLGHVFTGEKHTPKDTRHCVNSISLKFVPAGNEEQEAENPLKTETALFAGGSFWGVEHLMKNEPGVISTQVGYCGGTFRNPTYDDVCSGNTGHAETVRVVYDSDIVSFEKLAKLFFEIHDTSSIDGQGPDIGNQYRSAVFYTTEQQKETAERLIEELISKGYEVATEVTAPDTFWRAEDYHQKYYDRKGTCPYCHKRVKKF